MSILSAQSFVSSSLNGFNQDFDVLVHDMLKAHASEGTTLDLRDEHLLTPLMVAAACINMTALNALLQAGATVDLVNEQGHSALHCAAEKGNHEGMQALLLAGAQVDLADIHGWTALHLAARRGDIASAMLLKDNGANCSRLTKQGETPLLVAKQRGNKELYKLLKVSNRKVYYYSKEFRLRKHLAHMLNIAGTTTLQHPDSSCLEQVTFDLEGWSEVDFWRVLHKSTQAFNNLDSGSRDCVDLAPSTAESRLTSYPNELPDVVLEMMEAAANMQSCTPEGLFRRYSVEKKPIIIPTGYQDHHSSIVLWGGFFVLCERGVIGKPSFEVVVLDKKLVSQDFILELMSLRVKSFEEYVDFFKTSMHKYYAAAQLPAAIELSKLMRLPFQEIGNCAWANSVAVIYALLVLESVRRYAKLPALEQISLEEICKRQKVLFDTLQAFIIDSEIKKYTESHTKLTRVVAELYKSYYPPDPHLLLQVKLKMQAFIK